jgi:hypothetical protein
MASMGDEIRRESPAATPRSVRQTTGRPVIARPASQIGPAQADAALKPEPQTRCDEEEGERRNGAGPAGA